MHNAAIGSDVVVRYAGQVAAVALVGHEMAAEPFAEAYDDELAQFYARILLMPNDEFETLHGTMSDADIAEHFNVPLEQVAAKREDIELGL